MTDRHPPEAIYLQVLVDDDGKPVYAPGDDITWCRDKINDSDVKYVRADLVAARQDTPA